jgi:hypothetical protein
MRHGLRIWALSLVAACGGPPGTGAIAGTAGSRPRAAAPLLARPKPLAMQNGYQLTATR